MTAHSGIVYCKLSDGTPCANWNWEGKTPQAVAVLERRGVRMERIRFAKHAHERRYVICESPFSNHWPSYEYWHWSDMLRAEYAYVKSIVDEVMQS